VDEWNTIRAAQRRYERSQASAKKKARLIAVLDMETDPFSDGQEVYPFVCELYAADDFPPVVIWEENFPRFVEKVVAAIEALPDEYIIYAHNGGRFDFMFLISKIKGRVAFKGRGIMSAKIGNHELRDSFHIIPAALSAYRKDEFDYSLLEKANRRKKVNREKILAYLHADCVYLYEVVADFTGRYGQALSIGQVAWGLLKKDHDIKPLSEGSDEYLRNWFYGGRVECLTGPGAWHDDHAVCDVISMYPDRMAHCEHPIAGDFWARGGAPNKNTVFLEVECENFGALVGRAEDGSLTPNLPRGLFRTTIWEYEVARQHNLIKNAQIHRCIDFEQRTNFKAFVYPLFATREDVKKTLETIDKLCAQWPQLKRDELFIKLLLNNGFGKSAQNPRRFKEWCYTNEDEHPEGEIVGPWQVRAEDGEIWRLHASREGEFNLWCKPIPPSQRRYNNVATGASITGAARAKLLDALATCKGARYCDTDSIICREPGASWDMGITELGKWKVEANASELLIAGKKLYGFKGLDNKGEAVSRIRTKGSKGVTWEQLQAIVKGAEIDITLQAPTITKTGHQYNVSRELKMTCPRDYKSRIFAHVGRHHDAR
jgi:hypothetical protein